MAPKGAVGRPAAGERRRGKRLKRNEGEVGRCFLTTRGSLGGRERAAGETATVKIDAGGRSSRTAAAGSVGAARDPAKLN
jgi:hypothetical protein